MKIKLNPELSYIIGFWKKRRTKQGIGIVGEEDKTSLFVKEVLRLELTTPEKLLTEEEKESVYFYHNAYMKFFREIAKNECERFKYLNEYAANFLAGVFDSVGAIDEKTGIIYFEKGNKNDEIILMRLGFGCKWNDGKIIIGRPKAFLRFIQNYVKIFKDHKIFDYVGKSKTDKKNRDIFKKSRKKG